MLFVESRGVWSCVSCFVCTRSERRLRDLQKSVCRPMMSKDVKSCIIAQNRGHKLVRIHEVSDTRQLCPIYACQRCGCFAQRQFRKLGDECRLGKGQSSNSHRRIFVHGKHPRTGAVLCPPQRLGLPVAVDPACVVLHEFHPSAAVVHARARASHALDAHEASPISESD